jgi:uncharacterized membrane protein YhaH (DUF805 family)
MNSNNNHNKYRSKQTIKTEFLCFLLIFLLRSRIGTASTLMKFMFSIATFTFTIALTPRLARRAQKYHMSAWGVCVLCITIIFKSPCTTCVITYFLRLSLRQALFTKRPFSLHGRSLLLQ